MGMGLERLESTLLAVLRNELPAALAVENARHAGELQTVALSGVTGGAFRLAYGGVWTPPIAYNATPETVAAALRTIPTLQYAAEPASELALPGAAVAIVLNLDTPLPLTVDASGLTGSAPSAGVAASQYTVPPVVTWLRGVPPTSLDRPPEAAPILSVGVMEDEPIEDAPEDPSNVLQWGWKSERVVTIVGFVWHPDLNVVHRLGFRQAEAVKAVLRDQAADNLAGTCVFWPMAYREAHTPTLPATTRASGNWVAWSLEALRVRALGTADD
jgi:hypothetical protein